MKKSVRILLTFLLSLTFLVGITRLLQDQRDKTMANDTYEAARTMAVTDQDDLPESTESMQQTVPPAGSVQSQWVVASVEEADPNILALEEMNLDTLREVNPDVIGWILIPDTQVDYPILQGTDNSYYLNYIWDGNRNAAGSIFMEHMNNPDYTDFNTLIYGHNMINGSMFANIRNYRDQSYWETHPYVYIRNDYGVYRYEIFSSYEADVDSATYAIGFPGEEHKLSFLYHALSNSVISTGIEPAATDRVLTLSTCNGNGYTTRWVVHARLEMVPDQSY